MKQFAIIGLSKFGKWMFEELHRLHVEILVVDKDREVIELYKDKAAAAYVADVMNESTLRKVIPSTVDAVIIDVGDRIEASILATSHLKKMGVRNIVVKAESEEHSEILEIIGATRVVFPNREAAKRVAPILVSSDLFNYIPVSGGLVMAEVRTPDKLVGKTLVEANIRRSHGVNVIVVRHGSNQNYDFFEPEYVLEPNDFLLVIGTEEKVAAFSGAAAIRPIHRDSKRSFWSLFQ